MGPPSLTECCCATERCCVAHDCTVC